MAEARKIGAYVLRKKSTDTEDKENRLVLKKKRPPKEKQFVEKRSAVSQSLPRNKLEFKETAFRVYVDEENENDGEWKAREAARKVYETRSKDGKGEKRLPRIAIGIERKDALNRRGKIISGKNDGEKILAGMKQQQRKDKNKLAPNILGVQIPRRSSCTDATDEKRLAPKTTLRKSSSVTSLAAAPSEDAARKSKRLLDRKVLKKTTSVISLAVAHRGKEDYAKKLSPAIKAALRNVEGNKKHLLVSDEKQVQSNAAIGLAVPQRPRSKSADLVEPKKRNLQRDMVDSQNVKKSEKKWRIRFRSTDENFLKNLKPAAERKGKGLQEQDRHVFKSQSVKKRLPSTSSKTSDNVYLQPSSLNAHGQIITITPEEGAPMPTPKKAKLEHKICESEAGVDREFKETAPVPWEVAYHLQYLDDTMETEWEKQKNSYKLSADFLKRNINPEQRRILVSFLIHVGYHSHYPSFIMYQTVKLFDAAMDVISVDITKLQLAALACLFISLKKEENIHKVPTAGTILTFAKDQYEGRTDLLLQCEQHILCELDFQISFADPYTLFVYHLFHCKQYVHVNNELTSQLYYSAGYMIDISLLDEDFCHVPAILLGMTVAELLFCLFLDAGMDYCRPRWLYWRSLIERDRKNPERYCSKTIDTVRGNLIRNALHSCQDESSFKTVHKKYKLNRYGKISDILIEKMLKLPWDQYSGF